MGFKADKKQIERTILHLFKTLEIYDNRHAGQITHQGELNQVILDLQTILKLYYEE